MSAISSLTVLICCGGLGAGMLSCLIPQRRTRKILGFVLGLFMLVTIVNGIKETLGNIHPAAIINTEIAQQSDDDSEYLRAVVQQTADTLVAAVDELLREQDIAADDIRLKLKISDEGRITVDRIDIYISETYRSRRNDIRAVVKENLSKEPHIYVQGEKAE